ncbi:MAG: carbohydrate ABC transporter permease [Sphaerochaetaceae bacterium]
MVHKKFTAARFSIYLFLIIVALFSLFPIAYTLSSSFKSNDELLLTGATLIPANPSMQNYIDAWKNANFSVYIFNSLYITVFATIGSIIVTTLGGYSFSRGTYAGKKLIFSLFTGTMFLSLGTINLFPLLQITRAMHITGLTGVILIRVLGLNVASLFLVRGYVNTLPKELDEAAYMDGCSPYQIYLRIILPISKPIIATVGLLAVRATWNDWLLPRVFTLGEKSKYPLTVGILTLKDTGAAASSWNLMVAGAIISILPIIILYLMFNKYFIAGLTSGSVKG